MDFDSAYIEPLVDDWLKVVQEINKQQESLHRDEKKCYMPFLAIPAPIITAIFKLTNYLKLGADTKYMAVHLFDTFMCNYFWEVYKHENDAHQADYFWDQVCKKISSKSKLYLMACLQLASKMDSKSLKISQVLDVLHKIDCKSKYTEHIIFSTEFKVFKTVGFKVSFFTPISCIQVLLAATGLRETPNVQDLSTTLLDLAYLEREKLYSHFECVSQHENRNLQALKTNVLFLGSAIVLCGVFFSSSVDNQTARIIAARLSDMIDVDDEDIWNMANVLFAMALQE